MKSNLTLISFIIIIIACVATGTSLILGFAASIMITLLLLKSDGKDLRILMRFLCTNVMVCKSVYVLVLLMGMTISIWIASGIVPSLVYYGFDLINNMNFVLISFLATALVSVTMGTAIGVFSTIGMALFAIGKGLLIPDYILIGAIVSGAFVADKFSPVSSLTNLTIQLVDVEYKKFVKVACKTLIPTILITGIAYILIGSQYSTNIAPEIILSYQESILAGFKVNPLLALFPIVVVIMALMGIGIIKNLTISVVIGSFIALFFQELPMESVLHYLFIGFDTYVPIGDLGSILKGGGVLPMIEVVIIIMGSIALSGVLEGAGVIQPLLNKISEKAKTPGALICRTGIFSILMTMITCDQTVGILLPAKFLKEEFEDKGLSRAILARTISDTGTIVAPLFPWNVNTIIIVAITGVSAISYIPYAILCYIAPLVCFADAMFRTKIKGK